ncbi:hypothetical protein BDV25DRAFT_110807 [Aspergillus avenaceus]|uniref:Zn(2)-C6 fungal-type domain-containing protein n=1 Tax=Aspergillus avenaceus TaxID=36643 RepID=A0A5N6TW28_ASPAV|nr:hypothetical protein BDV25DRAFT_110807 [Aspergillus avenaceus]
MIGQLPLRPLAPKDELPPSDNDDGATKKGKRRRTSLACLECQKRRIKCGSGQPCDPCALHGRECVYDEYKDKRRKIAAELTQQNLHFYQEFVGSLLRAIQLGSPDNVERLINLIRQGAPLDDIVTMVNECLDQLPPPPE